MKYIVLMLLMVSLAHAGTEVKVVDDGVILDFSYPQYVDPDNDGIPTYRKFVLHFEDDGIYFEGEGAFDLCSFIPNLNNEQAYCDMDIGGPNPGSVPDGKVDRWDLAKALNWYDHPLADTGYGGDACFYWMRFVEYNRRLTAAGLPYFLFGVFEPPHCTRVHHWYPDF